MDYFLFISPYVLDVVEICLWFYRECRMFQLAFLTLRRPGRSESHQNVSTGTFILLVQISPQRQRQLTLNSFAVLSPWTRRLHSTCCAFPYSNSFGQKSSLSAPFALCLLHLPMGQEHGSRRDSHLHSHKCFGNLFFRALLQLCREANQDWRTTVHSPLQSQYKRNLATIHP